MAFIYKIENIINHKCYIGETLNPPNDRKVQHFSNLRNNRHCNRKLQNAFNKYGEKNFIFEVLQECDDNERFSIEIETIKKYNSFENGYNLTPGGDGPAAIICLEKIIRCMVVLERIALRSKETYIN